MEDGNRRSRALREGGRYGFRRRCVEKGWSVALPVERRQLGLAFGTRPRSEDPSLTPEAHDPNHEHGALRRELGLGGATLLGLGSMIGTGVFVSVGLAAGVAGPLLLVSIVLAAVLATANGLSSASLAARHPVSGGTYEYGHRWLTPSLGFAAGALFLLAKSASAATAALGFSGYVLDLAGWDPGRWQVPLAVVAVLGITLLVAGGIRRSNLGNAVVVTVALLGLALLVGLALPRMLEHASDWQATFRSATPRTLDDLRPLLHGAALMFVAFTGYGRIATLGEEVRHPERVIPRAVLVTVGVVTVLYLAVAAAGLSVLGAEAFGAAATRSAAPLEAVASALERPGLPLAVAVAAVAAMLGVLLNLVLGLSRVVLAMARRGDLPEALGGVDALSGSPVRAVWMCGLAIAALALIGDVRTTWSFSAFTVLVYYAITNLAALGMDDRERRVPRWVPGVGLMGCLGLAFMVETRVWVVGCGLLAAALTARAVFRAR